MVNIFENSSTPPNAPVDISDRIIEKNVVHQAENNAKEKFNEKSAINLEKEPKTPRNSIDTLNYAGSSDKRITNDSNLNFSKYILETKQKQMNVDEQSLLDRPRVSITIDRFCVQSVEDAALVMKELNNRPVIVNNVVVHDDSKFYFMFP